MQYVLLADVARQWLFEDDRQTDHSFDKANYFAIQITKQLNLHLVRPVKPVRLPVRANKTAVLPADFVGLHTVALVRGEELVTLTDFPRLALDRPGGPAGNPGATQALTVDPAASATYAPTALTPAFDAGRGHNAAGHYRLDLAAGQLILGADVPADAGLYVEYVASGIPASGLAQAPLYVEQVILSYLDWKMVDKVRTVPTGEKQRLQEEHKRQMKIAERFKNLTTKKALLAALNSSNTLTVR